MFIGHFGVALATKKVAPRPSLGTLVIAALLPDLLWSAFLLLRWERVAIVPGATVVSPLDFVSYPLSHSLVADTIWAAIVAGGYYAIRRDRAGAGWLAALVLSHWALDVVSHRPDVPILLGGPKVGLGLWNALPAALAAELGLLAVGTWVYAKATGARDRMGTGSLVALVALLTALYFASLVGPPPPSTEALAASGLAQWLFVAWAYWLDRHRAPRGQ
jgi:membrane-bound metal-dependent hydrolase YbcI (DUF457 family)